jgi:hypothetical protein
VAIKFNRAVRDKTRISSFIYLMRFYLLFLLVLPESTSSIFFLKKHTVFEATAAIDRRSSSVSRLLVSTQQWLFLARHSR